MKTYKVTIERRETLRHVLTITAQNKPEAENLAREQMDEIDWSDHNIIHGDEDLVSVAEVKP